MCHLFQNDYSHNYKLTINCLVHTHACEFMISKTSSHTKLWHAMTNIGAINLRHKNLWYYKKSWIAMKICDTLLPNGMPCHHHMEDQVVISCKVQQYFQLVNK